MQDLLRHVQEYVDNQVKLLKLEIAEKISKIGTGIITIVILIFFFFFFLLFASIALGFLIGTALNALWLGFLIVALFYCALGVGFFLIKDKLVYNTILDQMISMMFQEDDDENEPINLKKEKHEALQDK